MLFFKDVAFVFMKKATPTRGAAQTNHEQHKGCVLVGRVFHIIPSTFRACVPVKAVSDNLFINLVAFFSGFKNFRGGWFPSHLPNRGT